MRPALDRLSERVRRGLETVADVGEFAGCQVDALLLHFGALLLGVCARLLTVGARLQRFELGRHLLHGVRKFGQLSRDRRYVVRSCDFTAILRPGDAGRQGDRSATLVSTRASLLVPCGSF